MPSGPRVAPEAVSSQGEPQFEIDMIPTPLGHDTSASAQPAINPNPRAKKKPEGES
jgi:hypothetical protein